MKNIYPVILCGGSGTRLWPLSRKSFPKQFVNLFGGTSLYQASAMRLQGSTADFGFKAPMIITNSDFRFIVVEQLQDVGIDPGAIIIEPLAKNTAPAVLAAALNIASNDPEAIMLVAPFDHVMRDPDKFSEAIAVGIETATNGRLVTFGIEPTEPKLGYGYLQLSEKPDGTGRAVSLERFVEKPDLQTAQNMLSEGGYLWNSGIFLFQVKDIIDAYATHAADLLDQVRAAVTGARQDLGFLRLAGEPWEDIESISLDYAIMERVNNLSVVPYDGDWSDLGSWASVHRLSEDGVVTSGSVTAIDCKNALLRSEHEDLELVGLGVENLIAIAMQDAVLVANISRGQEVRDAVAALKSKGAKQAEILPVDYRPWGHFETLALSDRFQVKRIAVKPGAALSLQSHHHRSEHWIVVQGTARVTIHDEVKLMSENEGVYIPLGAKHRLENPGKVEVILIEVQTGKYLGEDDIVRYEDLYSRIESEKGR